MVQTFTGGGTGTSIVPVDFPVWTGHFTSTGQLGTGAYEIGTASYASVKLTRSDGTTLTGTLGTGAVQWCTPSGDVNCFTADLVGAGDVASAHLEIAIVGPPGRGLTPSASGFLMRGSLTLRRRLGYVMVDANGATHAFGGVDHLGDAPTTIPVTGMASTPSGQGCWIVNAAGQVFAFGDARYLGGADPPADPRGQRVVSIAATPNGSGYWLFTDDGRVLAFGDAPRFGDLATTRLGRPIVGATSTPTGRGYFMVAGDGGVFAFGDAHFHGSMGGAHLNQPVVGIVPTTDGHGYWLVASDGGVFSFNAPFHGSMGGAHLNEPIVALTPYGGGYLMTASDGGVFDFSQAPFFGSRANGGAAPIVAAAAVG